MTEQKWQELDRLLSQSEVLKAILAYRDATGCGLADAKMAIGTRFRVHHPERFATYRQFEDETGS
jgi:ribosomal protein L7/L12